VEERPRSGERKLRILKKRRGSLSVLIATAIIGGNRDAQSATVVTYKGGGTTIFVGPIKEIFLRESALSGHHWKIHNLN
jgi:hypothetical protein